MVVRVVSEGPVVTRKIACPTCAYELEYTGEDIEYITDYDGGTARYITCPRSSCKQGRLIVPRWVVA